MPYYTDFIFIVVFIIAFTLLLLHMGSRSEKQRLRVMRPTIFTVEVETGGYIRFYELEDAHIFCQRITSIVQTSVEPKRPATAMIRNGGLKGNVLSTYQGGREIQLCEESI